MIEFLSPAILAAVLRVSSSPIFSARLAMASIRTLCDVSGSTVNAARTQEDTRRV
jgi:hypothetical protein